MRKVWAVLDGPVGKQLAPFLGEIVRRLRACGELDIAEETAAKLCAMSAAIIDRRLSPDRKKMQLKGRSLTKPGSLLKSQIPIRTWADWDDAVPAFVEIDLVGREGGDPSGDLCHTLIGDRHRHRLDRGARCATKGADQPRLGQGATASRCRRAHLISAAWSSSTRPPWCAHPN